VSRIVAGTLGGRRIATPRGMQTRPTSDRVREALFSALESLTDLPGARFLDLYAGSGGVGLEAASRGAAHVLLVESDARVGRVIRENIAALGLVGTCRLVNAKVSVALAGAVEAPYDIAFADPPYDLPDADLTATLARLEPWLAADAVVAVERSTRSPEPVWPDGITPERARRYGESTLWYGRRVQPPNPPALEGAR
jgi:16S rRNA (guanine966-N2)-methyltransferase